FSQRLPLHSFPTRRSSDLVTELQATHLGGQGWIRCPIYFGLVVCRHRQRRRGDVQGIAGERNGVVRVRRQTTLADRVAAHVLARSEEHTSELQSLTNLVCR